MEFLFYGLEYRMIKEEINIIKDKYKINDINISHYNLNENSLKDVIEDASMISLFSDKKMIICENSNIFTSLKNDIEQDDRVLIDYLKNKDENTILIFTVFLEKLDARKKIVKLIENKKEFNKVNKTQVIKDSLKEYNVKEGAIEAFIKKTSNDTGIIINELEKLKNYKIEDKTITKEDVMLVTSETAEVDLFLLIDLIMKSEHQKAIEVYHKTLEAGEEPIKIIVSLANQFRLIYQTKEYAKQGLKELEIASKLGKHPYSVKLALQKSYLYSDKTIFNLLRKLAILDYNIKSGKVEKELAFELFILEV